MPPGLGHVKLSWGKWVAMRERTCLASAPYWVSACHRPACWFDTLRSIRPWRLFGVWFEFDYLLPVGDVLGITGGLVRFVG